MSMPSIVIQSAEGMGMSNAITFAMIGLRNLQSSVMDSQRVRILMRVSKASTLCDA